MKRLTALILAILVIIAVPVMASAANSPSGTETVKVDAKPSNTAQGSVEKTVNADGSVKLVATPAKGYTFKNWTITAATTTAQAAVADAQVATFAADTADYTIVSGSLTTATLVIKPNVDLVVVANFSGDSNSGSDSPDSPKTGEANLALVMFACALSLAGAGFAMKKAIA